MGKKKGSPKPKYRINVHISIPNHTDQWRYYVFKKQTNKQQQQQQQQQQNKNKTTPPPTN